MTPRFFFSLLAIASLGLCSQAEAKNIKSKTAQHKKNYGFQTQKSYGFQNQAIRSQSSKRPSVIIIDAGHGGHDRGGICGQKACEKALALDVARRLRTVLNDQGARTIMTRNSDTFVPLSQRAAIANAHPNALFVSIHFNSSWRRGASGFETFYYHSGSAKTAVRVESELCKIHGSENRGVKRRPYYVLRHTHTRAVLVECGFLTNPQEAARCQQADYRNRLARAIARGITKGSIHGG